MISNVPAVVKDATRLVVLRHPRSLDATVWKKVVTRVEQDPVTGAPSEMGGAPTLGGMGVLRSEDEPEFDYEERGAVKVLLCGTWEGQPINDRGNAAIQPAQEAQIVAVADPSAPEHFVPEVGDLVMVDMGAGAIFGFSIEEIPTATYIGPMIPRFVLQPRDDLHNLAPFEP